ncbi:MAG: glycosyltransferase family 4 protein [Clostridia bacterium]|nr:glycosyltransferase family 4 protein [Clostridia bacterium]
MKILFVDAYFFPETIAFTHLEHDLIESLIEQGHDIQVVCPVPTRGVSSQTVKEYRAKKHEKLYSDRVSVERFWAPQEGKNPIVRAFRYFWCNLREYQIAKKYSDVDVVFSVSTPPTQGLIAGKIAKKLKCPLVYSLQDVFPDSLVTTGLAKRNSILWKIGRKIENDTYKNAAQIIVISDSMKQNILEKGVSQGKITVIPNWIDTNAVKPVEKNENKLYEDFKVSRDKFTVVYAGNFGAAQGADVVLHAAERLKDYSDIQFVIFGGGAGFDAAKNEVANKKLSNVTINGLLPWDRVSEVYSLGDIALITCKKGVGTSGMPSKTWSIMACNTPIIASFDTDSELAAIVAHARAGMCTEPGNPSALADAIVQWYRCNNKQYTCKSRQYVVANASKEVCVDQYIKCLCKNSIKKD